MKVLNNGFVELIDHMGDQRRILSSARVSTGAQAIKGELKDRKLINYLWEHGHSSPFEQCLFTFVIKCPIAIARQWMRHRTGRYNEESGRYRKLEECFFEPANFRFQDTKNKQGSFGALSGEMDQKAYDIYIASILHSYTAYEQLLKIGVAREQARMVLPLAHMTTFYFNIDLHNLLKFLSKRLPDDAQEEIRVYAVAMLEMIRQLPNYDYLNDIFESIKGRK